LSQFRRPKCLTPQDEPTQRIRCPIHGFLHYSENERRIIDHPIFRRLRYIRQLALTEFVYPGATHTRFEHSLGVMEIATRAFDSLIAKKGGLIEGNLKELQGFENRPLAKTHQIVRLSALLHDTGHAAFSHAAEKVVHADSGHESLTVKIIQEEDLLGSLLTDLYGEELAKWTPQLIKPGKDFPSQLQFLRDLVSGEMDGDRADYLLRDSYHCGVDYERFDYRRMIECLDVIEEQGALSIALDREGIHTYEALVLARYQMNLQVYMHRLRRIYDHYFERYFGCVAQDTPITPEVILSNNDTTMLTQIFKDADDAKGKRGDIARRIRDRKHHRGVYETGATASHYEKRIVESLLSSIRAKYSAHISHLRNRKLWYNLRISDAGAEIGGDLRLSDMGATDGSSSFDAHTPSVPYNASDNVYLVVWQGDDDTAPQVNDENEIFFQVVAGATGAEVGPDERISDMGIDGDSALDAWEPDAAWNSTDNEFLVVWYGDEDVAPLIDGENENFGQRLDGAAVPIKVSGYLVD